MAKNVGHRFGPGNKAAVGNPGPTRLKPLTRALIKKIHDIDENTSKENIWTLVENLWKCAIGFKIVRYEGKGKDKVRIEEEIPPDLAALKYIWDRIEGTPVQSLGFDADGGSGGKLTLVFEPIEKSL